MEWEVNRGSTSPEGRPAENQIKPRPPPSDPDSFLEMVQRGKDFVVPTVAVFSEVRERGFCTRHP